jgi:mono/diheme cytochrome c family protein
MRRAGWVAWIVAVCLGAADNQDPKEFFETRIRPLLAKNCFSCHTSAKQGGLEMVSREAFLKGGNSGPAVKPGEPEQSLLIQAVRHTHAKLKMPPTGKLQDEEINELASWIKAGAVWPEAPPAGKTSGYVITPEQRSYWAFRPVSKPAPPAVKDRSWPKSPIDRFILARLEAKGLRPVRPADRRTLLRRVTYDLTGLPPSPEEIDAFLKDNSVDALAKVVDRLLASPHYGERWGRHWLDVARFSDDKLNPTQDEPVPNAFRYRDWVIRAFNDDMPYDWFVKAQIAGDLLPNPEKYVAGLGFYALRPEFQDDRVDATTRGFLGLTVACAQCHDHKFDPVPTQDYYSLLGVFTSSENREYPLASKEVVEEFSRRKKLVEDQEAAIKEFLQTQTSSLGEILAAQTARYLMAAANGESPADLDAETLDRWKAYLKASPKEHPYLKDFEDLLARKAPEAELRRAAEAFRALVLQVIKDKKEVDEKNLILLGGNKDRRSLSQANLASLERDKYFLWRDLFSEQRGNVSFKFRGGVFYYGDKSIDRFLSGPWKTHLESLRAELEARKKALPEQYPFLLVIGEAAKAKNERIQIRGSRDNLGEEAPRRFLSILCPGEPAPFTNGSGRLELAEAIASAGNPLTARVMVNRIWQHHFGQGIVRTPSNFGQLGERPDHPELLDWLAARFVEGGWSVKKLHREIVLSATYGLSAAYDERNFAADPGNRLRWRFDRRRLDVEEIRDSILAVSGLLDRAVGGPAAKLEDTNRRRTVYGFVSRRKLDPLLALFDFPNPTSTAEARIVTNVPIQRLFFLNSSFLLQQAEALARRVESEPALENRIRGLYRFVYGRPPTAEELRLGREFQGTLPQYAQALLSSNEFLFVD